MVNLIFYPFLMWSCRQIASILRLSRYNFTNNGNYSYSWTPGGETSLFPRIYIFLPESICREYGSRCNVYETAITPPPPTHTLSDYPSIYRCSWPYALSAGSGHLWAIPSSVRGGESGSCACELYGTLRPVRLSPDSPSRLFVGTATEAACRQCRAPIVRRQMTVAGPLPIRQSDVRGNVLSHLCFIWKGKSSCSSFGCSSETTHHFIFMYRVIVMNDTKVNMSRATIITNF